MKKIALLTSGGDAPGMNAAIRSVVRSALTQGCEVVGISSGYRGLLEGHFQPMSMRSVANIIQTGGTILKTDRCQDFFQPNIRAKAAAALRSNQIDGLIVIGGDGSFRGGHLLGSEQTFPIIGIPGTIDNDIFGTDLTIGFDTAVNTALDCIDRIRDTAASHSRLFIVEVMGRSSGFIAVNVALAAGAEEVFIPERPVAIEQVCQQLTRAVANGKLSSILVAAEGQKPGRAYDLAEAIRKKSGFESRVCVLGHIQRGGKPTAVDRNLASRMGFVAVQALLESKSDLMVGIQSDRLVLVPLANVLKGSKQVSPDLLKLLQTLSK